MKILKASHRKGLVRKRERLERTSQSIMRRMARENKCKERVRASINRKHVAAEKKCLGLLEAEKKKARDRVQQVRHVANSVSNQREMERSKFRDKLKDKLQRAKRHRSEFLPQRRRYRDSISLYCDMMQEDDVLLSRKLSRCWRCFVRHKRTTLDLAKAYDGLKINESLPFEQLPVLIESPITLRFACYYLCFQNMVAISFQMALPCCHKDQKSPFLMSGCKVADGVGNMLERYSSMTGLDGTAELQMLAFKSSKIRLLRSMAIKNESMQIFDYARFHGA